MSYSPQDRKKSVAYRASQVASGKELPANAGNMRDTDLIPGPEISPGEGHGNPLQYSCLENPMDRDAAVHWVEAAVHWVAQSQTRLKGLSARARMHAHAHTHARTRTRTHTHTGLKVLPKSFLHGTKYKAN